MAFSSLRLRFGSEQGQILLVVVLVMVTTLTVGLSLVSRNITNLKTSTEEANSQKALSAAEAGVEKAIQTGGAISFPRATIGPDVSYQASVTQVSSPEIALKNGSVVEKDDSVDVWLSNYPDFTNPWGGGNIEVFWGESGQACPNSPALEIVMMKEPVDNPVITRTAIDSCGRNPSNSFDTSIERNLGTQTCSGANYPYKKTLNAINAGGTPILMRILPIYASTPVCIKGPVSFPNQGFIVDSRGYAGSTERRVRVYQGFPRAPIELFPYGLFQP